jgi:hypothetical protein
MLSAIGRRNWLVFMHASDIALGDVSLQPLSASSWPPDSSRRKIHRLLRLRIDP